MADNNTNNNAFIHVGGKKCKIRVVVFVVVVLLSCVTIATKY